MTTIPKPPEEISVPAQKRMTLEEFVAMGEGPPYYEFEDGVLIPRNGEENPMGSPGDRHQVLLGLLFAFLYHFVLNNKLGRVSMDVDVFLPDGKMYIPDITFLAANGGAYVDPADDKIHGSPELVVEILSSDARRDRIHKLGVYKRNGIRWYWIIDPGPLTLEEYQFLPDGTTQVSMIDAGQNFQPSVFPGLTLNLAALMGELPAAEHTGQDTAANPPIAANERE